MERTYNCCICQINYQIKEEFVVPYCHEICGKSFWDRTSVRYINGVLTAFDAEMKKQAEAKEQVYNCSFLGCGKEVRSFEKNPSPFCSNICEEECKSVFSKDTYEASVACHNARINKPKLTGYKWNCNNCHKTFSSEKKMKEPYCSDKCKDIFIDKHPVAFLTKSYEDFYLELTKQEKMASMLAESNKEFIKYQTEEVERLIDLDIRGLEDAEERDNHLIREYENFKIENPAHCIDTIYCESCRSTLDYGYIDDRIIITCSPDCSDVFLETLF